jgi:hypothetical protein
MIQCLGEASEAFVIKIEKSGTNITDEKIESLNVRRNKDVTLDDSAGQKNSKILKIGQTTVDKCKELCYNTT